MHDIHLIVDRLREYKFEEDLTLVTFDEKAPQELLETLNNVLKNLSKDHDVDVRDEPIEQTAQRIFYFIPVLMVKNVYTYEGDLDQLQNSLQQGDREFIYPLLHHMLSRLPDLRKRAYVSKFLTPLDMPEDMFADNEIMPKWTEYQELQQTFKDTHKATDKLKGTSLQPTELKREVTQLEEEKGQLKTKINKLDQKLRKLENFQELYDVTSRLRKEQEEEAKLAERFQEQSMQFKQAEARMYQSQKKLRDVQMSASDGSTGEDILKRLEEDVRMTREHCEHKLPLDIEAKRQRLEQVKRLYDMPEVRANDLTNEEDEIERLREMEQRLLEKQKAQMPKGDDKLGMFRQQAMLVASKKEKMQDRHGMLSEDLKALEEDLADKRAKLGHGVPRILKGAEFQKYAEGLKGKAKQYKKLKGELSSVVAEKGILSRTEDILKTRHGDQSEFLSQLEKDKGISGAASLQDRLEEVSEKTMEVNKKKEVSLEEISKTVEQINNVIKEKKGKLAPLIKELRQVRTDFSQLESEYNEKKSLYESTAAGLDTERDKLTGEVTAYQDECKREESRYHYLNAMIESTKIILERARLEDAGRNRVGDANQSYRELYQSRIQETENLSKKLRERQKMVKESHEGNLEQTTMFKDLRKVLQGKLHTLKAYVADTQTTTSGNTNLMVMD